MRYGAGAYRSDIRIYYFIAGFLRILYLCNFQDAFKKHSCKTKGAFRILKINRSRKKPIENPKGYMAAQKHSQVFPLP